MISTIEAENSLCLIITNEFIIERAYPEYIGNENDKDLREDPRIYNALKVSHKLK